MALVLAVLGGASIGATPALAADPSGHWRVGGPGKYEWVEADGQYRGRWITESEFNRRVGIQSEHLARGGRIGSAAGQAVCDTECQQLWSDIEKKTRGGKYGQRVTGAWQRIRQRLGLLPRFGALPLIGAGVTAFTVGWQIGATGRKLFWQVVNPRHETTAPVTNFAPKSAGDSLSSGGGLGTLHMPWDGYWATGGVSNGIFNIDEEPQCVSVPDGLWPVLYPDLDLVLNGPAVVSTACGDSLRLLHSRVAPITYPEVDGKMPGAMSDYTDQPKVGSTVNPPWPDQPTDLDAVKERVRDMLLDPAKGRDDPDVKKVVAPIWNHYFDSDGFPDPELIVVPAPGASEVVSDYLARLDALDLTGVASENAADAINPAKGPMVVTYVAPSPGMQVDAGTEVMVRHNPASASDPGGWSPPAVRAPDLSPLATIGSPCDVFPFGVFCWVHQALGGWGSSAACPSFTLPLGSSLGLGSGLEFDGCTFEPAMAVVRPLVGLVSMISLVYMVAAAGFGFGGGRGDED